MTGGERPVCVVFGNCQAEALQQILPDSPAFAAEYEVVPIATVHKMTAAERAELEPLLARTSLLITQPIRNGYRDMPLGTDEITAVVPAGCRILRFPVLYYRALFPFQAFVHLNGGSAVNTPMTEGCHDLRFVRCAGEGMDLGATVEWLGDHVPDAAALRGFAVAVSNTAREREAATDIPVFDRIVASPGLHSESFFTVNHPTRRTLRLIAESIHEALGIPYADTGTAEPLDMVVTPIEQEVLSALDLPGDGSMEWLIYGKPVPMEDMVAAHLDYYRRRPDILAAALAEHANRLSRLPVTDARRPSVGVSPQPSEEEEDVLLEDGPRDRPR